ncbi:MAG TPA: LysR substrate-binding domain-containing protein [Casimicrobiaceae bacterium]|nr:LysR substrate-binding domain-containing protein [Casimicrobiaceae bacterium]
MARLPVLPTLDFFRGFDAAVRHKSFTRAAEELHLTQSALSREIKKLEEEIGTALFARGRRGLELTPAGETLHVVVRSVLREVAQAVATIRARGSARRLTVSTTVTFASLWLVPRLPHFREQHPDVEVFVSADNRLIDLDRGEVDLAVRFTQAQKVPQDALRLFGEGIVPVASPKLVAREKLKRPEDLARVVLLHLEDARVPWLDWPVWLTAAGVRDLAPAGNLRFSQYDQLLQAAIAGQGIALGRRPLIDAFLAAGALVMPFAKRYDVPYAYFAIPAAHARERPEAAAFLAWLMAEASGEALSQDARATPRRRRPS